MSKNKKLLLILVFFTSLLILLLFLDYFGIIWHNSLFASKYSVKGIDVSHHQGEIDWQKVAATNKYSFVFIKATEGHDFTDDKFEKNWQEAKINGLRVGAYHFFSMRSSGNTQAEHFISVVPNEDTFLAPVLDIEISLNHDPESVRKEISDMSTSLENYYHKKPILYVTYSTYNQYVKNYFSDHKIWIRDVIKFPNLNNRDWVLWQYNNRGRVSGINAYVDINVLNGELNDLE